MDMAGTRAFHIRQRVPLDAALILAACALLAAVIQSFFIPIDADVSWLITVSERVLAGQRLYVDLFEVNPPASVWLYLPMVWLAQLAGLRPEAVVAATAIAAALCASVATLQVAARLRQPPPAAALAAVLAFTTLILPGGLFAQREHFAALLALPSLATLALIADRQRISRTSSLAAGLAAGLVIVIKPHFALALLPAAFWAACRARALRPLLPGVVGATLLILAYAAALLAFARAYLDYLPLLSGTYLHMRERWLNLLAGPSVFMPVALLVLAAMLRRSQVPPLAISWFIGAMGFGLASIIQGKGYANHAFPGSVLGFMAVVVLITIRAALERKRLVGAAVLVLALTKAYTNFGILPPEGLAEAVRRVAPPRPTMITLGTELVTGHPVVRNVDGRWVGSRASLFTVAGVQYRRSQPMPAAERAQLERWYGEDVQSFALDVAAGRPDVVLVEIPEKRWIVREPVLMNAMRDYRFAARTGTVEVWLRR